MFCYRQVFDVKRRYERELLGKGNVIGVGIGYKMTGGRATEELSTVVLVSSKIRPFSILAPYDAVPSRLEGITTDVLETGVIRVLPTPVVPKRQTPIRPAPGGCSVGHYALTAGTLGCLVKKGNETFILSNNHVLADENRGVRGDDILQPGPYDGGKLPEHKIAELESFATISFGGINRVDAAIARPMRLADVTNNVIGIGDPRGVVTADLGMPVIKSGRTTEITRDYIAIVDATLNIEFSKGVARFENQLIVVKPGFSSGGDSGSVVLINNGTRKICGLLFAGSEYVTVINRIEDVINALGISL